MQRRINFIIILHVQYRNAFIISFHFFVFRWHTGTITNHHIKQFQVMGVCIPERLHVQDLMSNATLVGKHRQMYSYACLFDYFSLSVLVLGF